MILRQEPIPFWLEATSNNMTELTEINNPRTRKPNIPRGVYMTLIKTISESKHSLLMKASLPTLSEHETSKVAELDAATNWLMYHANPK